MEEDFSKSRRNLVVLSSVIIFYVCSGISIEKINLLGNEADITNPRFFELTLALIFSYFFSRFHHHSKKNKDSEEQPVVEEEITEIYPEIEEEI